ncbi:MAG: hypothetical protein M1829_006225 [Trizodia sp. TS-e1964]|nr:MAG: hypothetical protein M1829_006225 [Trizodia sp. TS-e1964]
MASYVDSQTAHANNLVVANAKSAYIGVDYTTKSTTGRASVRITSKQSYNHGLIIADIAHMPGGICGTWPAFWTVGPDWPNDGEIDILEGINENSQNAMTLHTSNGCSVNPGPFSGTLKSKNCYNYAPGQGVNEGCQIQDQRTNSYGSGFNAIGGGVYATEWTSDSIKIWFFPRGNIPADIPAGHPNPSTWGSPVSSFGGACTIDQHFKNQQIVFDTTFCGDWAGNTWAQSSCGKKAASCSEFVAQNPAAFKEAFWSINSVKVYQ